jgi:hypothetical protein
MAGLFDRRDLETSAYPMNVPWPSSSTLPFLVLIPLVAWRYYARFKRMVSRQRLSKVRPWITLTIFPLLVLMLGAGAWSHPATESLLFAGVGVGVGLGIFGLGKTRFEATPEGLFYTPHAHLGIALSLLMLCRIVYRFIQLAAQDVNAPRGMGMDDFARSPLTLAVFGLLAGYYVAYAVGLLRWRASVPSGT